MSAANIETVYEALALKLDTIPTKQHPLYLAKLALLLAHEIDDAPKVITQLNAAAQNLST
ncbi:MAG TPA: hypothetical protein DEF12_11780 [Rhodobacteraceae bacterium]|jgi:hypothetical protein|nr:hypothetical protein [Paracoccaceae bacterium]HBV55695.1 hypothetical protein [Paracoccaceae bacterium]